MVRFRRPGSRDVLIVAIIILVSCCEISTGSAECNWNGEDDSSGCQCYEGFKGSNCDVDCGCEGHGTCNDDDTCACESGWKWSGSDNKCVWDCPCGTCIGPNECGCSTSCVNGACRNGVCVCYNGFTGASCDALDRSLMPNKDVQVGINLGRDTYYTAELKFVDIFKTAMPWITQREGDSTWDTKELDTVSLREDGYPNSLEDGLRLATLFYRGFGQHEETGDYTLLYDGEGEIAFRFVQYSYKYKGKGRLIVTFEEIKSEGVALMITKTNPSNPLHNIRILPPGYEYNHERFPFHPVFLDGLLRYSQLRYKDFQWTDHHEPEPTTWATRRKPDYYTQSESYGVAIEYLVQLANMHGSDPWFCMPHAADDDYVKNFAQYVKANLRSDLKIYIEYSNEVWNGIYRQTWYTREQGAVLFPDDADFKQGMRYYNLRSSQIADIWLQEFGADSDRVVTVWAWQTGFRDYTRQALEDLADKTSSFKAMAITGYFDCDHVADDHGEEMKTMSMADIATYCDDGLSKMQDDFNHYISVSQANGMKLLMYEGGPGVMESQAIASGTSDDEVAAQAIAFNRDNAIVQPTLDVLEAWQSIVTEDAHNQWPGGLFNYFTYSEGASKYGSWGMLEYTGQKLQDVPKYRAVATFISNHYPDNPLGPHCSFVKGSSESYGCYRNDMSSPKFDCGKTSDNGATWSTISGLTANDADYVVLDGANLDSNKLYIRVLDAVLASPTFHSYSLDNDSWTELDNFYYYSELMGAPSIPRLPDGASQGLVSGVHCGPVTTIVG